MRTGNGGTSWIIVHDVRGGIFRIGSYFLGVSFADAMNGTAVGAVNLGPGSLPRIARTSDGGGTWESYFLDLAQFRTPVGLLKAVTFVDPNTGWIVGETGTILHTTTGGM